MSKIKHIFSVALSVLLVACSGNVDDTALPVLTASDLEIDLASETQTVFTVTYNGVDVTSESEIHSVLSSLELIGNVFTPVETYYVEFYAVYDGLESEPVGVNVINSKPPQVESKYKRHICVMEFTGAWCVNCPDGYDNMMLQLSKPSMSGYKENLHLCAFHSNAEGNDTLAIAATQDVIRMFSGLAYPSFVVDMRPQHAGLLTSDGIGDFQPAVKASAEEYPTHCGVAVSSVVSDGVAKISARIASEFTTEYRMIILVVQDIIKGYQKHSDYGELSDYSHRHVVRKVVTSYEKTFTGEKLTDDGIVSAGETAEKQWNVELDDRWVLENTEIYALALDANGYVNNMNVCAINGGDSGFDIK